MKNETKAIYAVNDEQIEYTHIQGKFTALFTHPQPAFIKGCPMGRGDSCKSARMDLYRRTNDDASHSHKLIHVSALLAVAESAKTAVEKSHLRHGDYEDVRIHPDLIADLNSKLAALA